MALIPELIAKREDRIRQVHDVGGFWVIIIFMLMLLAAAVRLFGSPAPSAVSESPVPTPIESHQPRIYTVSYRAGVFSPTNLRIHAGDTVRFKNDGLLAIHVITDSNAQHDELPGFDSVGDIPAGSYFAFTFAAKGIFGYHNERNSSETGTIIVR